VYFPFDVSRFDGLPTDDARDAGSPARCGDAIGKGQSIGRQSSADLPPEFVVGFIWYT